jgi:hypothetical protein
MSQLNPPSSPAASPIAPKVKKPIYKRKWVIALVALILFYWVAPKKDSSNSTSNSKSSTSSTSSSSTIPEVAWSKNLRPEVLPNELALTTCKELSKVISAQSKIVASRISATEKPSSDPYDSSEYLQTIDWEDTRQSLVILEEKAAVANPILAAGSLSIPTDSQYKGFVTDSITACGLETVSSDLDKSANRLDSRLISMQSSANNLPWYPKGFSEYFPGFAFKKSTKKGLNCYSCWGIVFEVISNKSCPDTLYIEANFLDSSGAIADWSNETVRALTAGTIAYVQLVSYSMSGTGTVDVTKVNCY